LSHPFVETLAAVRRYHERREVWGPDGPVLPFQMVEMSATPPPNVDSFCIDADDRADPVLAPRLEARKLARLQLVECGDDEAANRERFASAARDAALAFTEDP